MLINTINNQLLSAIKNGVGGAFFKWKNPIKKVKSPKLPVMPLESASIEIVSALHNACDHGTFSDARDQAIFLFLLDTGVRQANFYH